MTYRQRYNFVEQHHGRHMKIEYEILEKNKTKKKKRFKRHYGNIAWCEMTRLNNFVNKNFHSNHSSIQIAD